VQSRVVVTASAPVAPAAGTVVFIEFWSLIAHLAGDGAVVVSVVLLLQAGTRSASAHPNSRARIPDDGGAIVLPRGPYPVRSRRR
jgi:hypothetical protein